MSRLDYDEDLREDEDEWEDDDEEVTLRPNEEDNEYAGVDSWLEMAFEDAISGPEGSW